MALKAAQLSVEETYRRAVFLPMRKFPPEGRRGTRGAAVRGAGASQEGVPRLGARGKRERLRAQQGFTLIEQLVSILILVVVVGATLTALESMLRAAPADQEWSHIVANTQAGLYRMTRELRQGTSVTLVTPYVISADVVLKGETQHVLYQCDLSSSCTRKSTTAPAAAPSRGAGGTTVIASLQNFSLGTSVFTSPSTKYFQVSVIVRSAGALVTKHTHNVTLTDGFFARNS
jgi:prepilin-type N-terminal cleavage/methylation domain-containing protein